MGLRCLLGHEFGEREVERERREAGDEVVVVYRTVENCRRCGSRRVVSENKEVRSIGAFAGTDDEDAAAGEGRGTGTDGSAATDDRPDGTPSAAANDGAGPLADGTADDGRAGADSAGPAGSGLVEAAEAVGTPGDGEDTDDAVIIGGNGTTDGSEEDGAETGTGAETPPETDADGTPATETASGDDVAPEGGVELLGDDGDDGTDDGGTGDAVDAGDDAAGGWPTPSSGATDEGYDATPHDDTGTGVEFGGGFAPKAEAEATGTDGDGVEPAFVRAADPSVAARDADGPTELCCPNCGATRTAAGSSMRGGDICPECRKGYVAERAVEE